MFANYGEHVSIHQLSKPNDEMQKHTHLQHQRSSTGIKKSFKINLIEITKVELPNDVSKRTNGSQLSNLRSPNTLRKKLIQLQLE